VRAFQDCSLIVPVNNTIGPSPPQVRQKVARMPVPSAEQVARELTAAGLAPRAGAGAGAARQRAALRRPSFLGLALPTPSDLLAAVEHWPWPRWKNRAG